MESLNLNTRFTEPSMIESSKNPIYEAIKTSGKKLIRSSGFSTFIKIFILLILLFIVAVCCVNIAEYVKIREDYVDNNAAFKDSVKKPVQSISEIWIVFGIVANSMILVLAFVLTIYIIVLIFRGNNIVEKDTRKLVRQTITGARIYAEQAVNEAIPKVIIDPTDFEGSKAFIATTIKSRIGDVLDRYLTATISSLD